jgi:urease gamma subunit
VSTTEVTANVTIAANATTGSRSVTVTDPDTTSATGPSLFTVNGAPTVTSATPGSRGQGAAASPLTIKGSGFVNGASASFGTGISVSTTFKSSTELAATVTVEAGASIGTRTVTVTNPDQGVGSLANGFSVVAGPNVESTNPSSRSQGASKQTVAIKGTGFVSGATPSFGAGITLESTNFVSATELSAKIAVEPGAGIGARTVVVTNPDGGTDTLPGGFTVTAGPSIEAIGPNTGDKGAALAVAFSGTGITVNSASFKSSTELTANIAIEAAATTGARTVTVTNGDGGTGSLAGGFTVNNAPSIESLSPSSRAQGATSQTILIKGANFESGVGLQVAFSGTGITVNSASFVNTTEVSANITVASNAATGARTLTLTNPDTTSATATFTVTVPPTVTSTTPSSRGQGAPSQAVVVKGSGFVSGATVSFGPGVTASSSTFKSSTELSVNVTVESTATVTNPDTSAGSLVGAFTVNAKPVITSPTSSSRVKVTHNTSTTLKVGGSNFVSGAVISISGGFTVNPTVFVGTSELQAKVEAGHGFETGTYSVTVTNPDGGSTISANSIENT